MARLLADIALRAGGNSDACVLLGWAEAEPAHRWTLGRQSTMRLQLGPPGTPRVVAISATPCLDPPGLAGQTVMLALDGRLLATWQLGGLQAAAFDVPPELDGEVVLGIAHLSHAVPRRPAQTRRGEPLGLMVHSLRAYRLDAPGAPAPRPSSPPALAARFESLGQGCHFGLVQRQCGVEPLGLLRFVDTTTSMLADGLVRGFAGIGAPGRLDLSETEDAQPRWRWRHRDYGLMYDTRLPVASWDPRLLARREQRRLEFLRRKFAEDLASAEKICVLTRGDRLTEPEALAVWCALRLHGPVTLLWTVAGDEASAGRVDRLRPGLLRGHLGRVDRHGYAALDVWRRVMEQAVALG